MNAPTKLPRQDLIGSWIQNSEWFPIEINVPDLISSFGNGISSGFMNLSDAFGSWIQGIPLFDRFTSQSKPRPFKYIIFVPVKDQGQFNPFDSSVNYVPMYP